MKPAPIPAYREWVMQEKEDTGTPMSYLESVAMLYFLS